MPHPFSLRLQLSRPSRAPRTARCIQLHTVPVCTACTACTVLCQIHGAAVSSRCAQRKRKGQNGCECSLVPRPLPVFQCPVFSACNIEKLGVAWGRGYVNAWLFMQLVYSALGGPLPPYHLKCERSLAGVRQDQLKEVHRLATVTSYRQYQSTFHMDYSAYRYTNVKVIITTDNIIMLINAWLIVHDSVMSICFIIL